MTEKTEKPNTNWSEDLITTVCNDAGAHRTDRAGDTEAQEVSKFIQRLQDDPDTLPTDLLAARIMTEITAETPRTQQPCSPAKKRTPMRRLANWIRC